MKRVLVVAGMALALTACSHPSSGRVIGKHIDPPRSWVSCSLVGKVTVCTPHTDDQDWVLNLRNGEDEWGVEVTPERYDSTSVGDTYTEAQS